MRDFSADQRERNLERAAENLVDVVIVGGGISGAGIAREAALRGLTVVLLDQGDFASGTSSRSSKLIHGGVRYLEQGDVALVREAARERAVLRTIAPHLAVPVRMLIPARSQASRLKVTAGLWTFERLAGEAASGGYAGYDRAKTLAAEPGLRSDRLAGAVAYTEYVTNDARLTLETIKSAHDSGAWVANYAAVEGVTVDAGGVRATVHDRLTDRRLEVRARAMVNAAGPWFDRVRGLTEAGAESLLQLTRGIHVVVPSSRLPVAHAVILRAPDGRSTFVVPRGEFSYIGTTDTVYDADPREPGVSSEDVDYLLDSVAATFEEGPSRADIIGTWSGVRPLLREPGKAPSEISRRDEIRVGPGPIVSIAGGKLTTYRRMGERVVADLLKVLGRTSVPESGSARLPLVGGSAEDQARARSSCRRLEDPALEERLWATYGVAAVAIVERLAADPSLAEPVGGIDRLTAAELEHCVDEEMVVSLDDMLRRRSPVAMFDTRRALGAAAPVARHLGDRLGWDEERVAGEVERFCADRAKELATVRCAGNRGH